MQNKERNNKKFKIGILILVIILIVIFIVAINIYNKKSMENQDILKGTFVYNNNVKYEFNEKGEGAMYDGDTKYEYTYKIDDKKVTMDFKDEIIHDATYTFNLEDDILTLIGGEGTTGGEYTLKKENK